MRLSRFSFWAKVLAAAALVTIANLGLYDTPGPGLGAAAPQIALVLAVALIGPARWRTPLSAAALGVAALFAMAQIDRPSVLATLFVLLGVGVSVLSPRAGAGDDAWRWALRLASSVVGLASPFLDAVKLNRVLRARGKVRVGGIAVAAIAPVVGGALFLGLFVAANPLLARALGDISFLKPDPGRIVFCALAAAAAWTALRPWRVRFNAKAVPAARRPPLPPLSVAPVIASLVIFNLIFALQNGLDIAFLWSGAPLPDGMTHAEYAHRGAYPLIATALLAGLFVLVFLRPGWPTADSPAVRRLVVLWIAQNVLLVGSTMLRTVDYIDAFSLTRMRIAALIWMSLVAVGLVLICWRQVRGKSGSWLINANALCAAGVLAACAVTDLGAIAATWNARQFREAGPEAELDVDYLGDLNGAGLVALARLERGGLPPSVCAKVHATRGKIREAIAADQKDWRAWRWRDARRLETDARIGGDCLAGLATPPLTPAPKP